MEELMEALSEIMTIIDWATVHDSQNQAQIARIRTEVESLIEHLQDNKDDLV